MIHIRIISELFDYKIEFCNYKSIKNHLITKWSVLFVILTKNHSLRVVNARKKLVSSVLLD